VRQVAHLPELHSENVILMAFPLQQWVHERTSLLLYTYIACLVLILIHDKDVNVIIFLLLWYTVSEKFLLRKNKKWIFEHD